MQSPVRAFLVVALAATLLVDATRTAATEHHPLLSTAQVNRGRTGYVPAPPPAEPIAVPRMDLPANYVGEPPPLAPAPAAPAPPPPPQPSAPPLGTNFQGITFTNAFPPDPIMAAGPSELLLMVNGGVGLFTKTGTATATGTLDNFYNGSLSGSHTFDPKTLYDPHSGRFFTVALDGQSSPKSWLRIAVSKSSNPANLNVGSAGTDDWWGFDIDADKDGGSQVNNNWADFPSLGVDQDNLYVTANMFSNSPGSSFQYAKVWVIHKAGLVSGGPITVFEFGAPPMTALTNPTTGFKDNTIQPALDFDLTNEHMLATNALSGPDGDITFWTVNNPATTPTLSATDLLVASWNGFTVPACPQLGGGANLDTGDTRMQRVIERSGSIWATHGQPSPDAMRAEVRWYEINTTPAVVQYGQVTDATRCYFFPAIHPDAAGNVCLVMSGVDATIHGSAFYTGRATTDGAGTMQAVGLLKDGLAKYVRLDPSGRNRWGDFGGIADDPSTGDIWMLHEFASATMNKWSTWVGMKNFGPTTTSTTTTTTTTTLPFSGDDPGCIPANQNRLKCGDTIVKAAAKLFKAVDKCHCNQAKARLAGVATANIDEEACEESNAGKAAKEKYDATKAKLVSLGICTATQLANMDMLRDELLAYLDGARNANIYCDGSTPIGDDDMGNVASSTSVLGCECSAGKNAAKLYAAALQCHFKNADSLFKQKVPPFGEEACEETSSPAGKGAHDKYTAAAGKLIAKGTCPPCLDSAAEHEALATADLGVAESKNDKPYPCE